MYGAAPAHYYVFGGDNEVEVMAATDPEIEEVHGPQAVAVTHAV